MKVAGDMEYSGSTTLTMKTESVGLDASSRYQSRARLQLGLASTAMRTFLILYLEFAARQMSIKADPRVACYACACVIGLKQRPDLIGTSYCEVANDLSVCLITREVIHAAGAGKPAELFLSIEIDAFH